MQEAVLDAMVQRGIPNTQQENREQLYVRFMTSQQGKALFEKCFQPDLEERLKQDASAFEAEWTQRVRQYERLYSLRLSKPTNIFYSLRVIALEIRDLGREVCMSLRVVIASPPLLRIVGLVFDEFAVLRTARLVASLHCREYYGF